MTFSTNPAHYPTLGAQPPYDVHHWSSGVQPGQPWARSTPSKSRPSLPPQDLAFAQACQPGQGWVLSTTAVPMGDGELVAMPMSYGGGWGGPAGFWPPHQGPSLPPRHQHQRGRSGQPSFRPPTDTHQSVSPRLTIDTSPKKKHTYRQKGKVSASASASKTPKAFNAHIRPQHMPSQHILTTHIITPHIITHSVYPNTCPTSTSITRGMSHLAISPARPDNRIPTIPPLASRVSIRPPGYRPPATSPSATPPTLPVTPQGDPEPLVLINSPTLVTPSIVITPPGAAQRVFEPTWGITPTNDVEDMFLAHLGGTLDALACGRRWAYVEGPAAAADDNEEGQGVAVPSHDFDSTNATNTHDTAVAVAADTATDATDTLANTTTTTTTDTNTNTTDTHTTNITTTHSNRTTTTTTTTTTNTTAHPTRPAFNTRDRAIDTALLNWHLGVRPSLGKGDMRAEFIAAAVGAFRARVGAALAVGLAE